MKPEHLTKRLLAGLPAELKEASVTRDAPEDCSPHHSVVRIQGITECTVEKVLGALNAVLGEGTLEAIAGDAKSGIVYKVGTAKSNCRMCVWVTVEQSEATMATYHGPEAAPMDAAQTGDSHILRIRHTG